MDRRGGLFASGVLIGVLIAVPISLVMAGLLLPGDPDDPNTKALALGLATAVPAVATAAGIYALVVRLIAADSEDRSRLAGYLKVAIPGSIGALLLLLAWKVAYETPAAETAAQAAGSPYLWRSGALRMAGAGAVLTITSALLVLTSGRLSAAPLPRTEDRP